MTVEELNNLPFQNTTENPPGLQPSHQNSDSLTNFLHTVFLLSHHRQRTSDSLPRPAQVATDLSKGMSPKKLHEVERMASLVHQLAVESGCSVVVDVGSGLGYLGQVLHKTYGLSVIGLESSKGHSEGAEKRAAKQGLQCSGIRSVPFLITQDEDNTQAFCDLIRRITASIQPCQHSAGANFKHHHNTASSSQACQQTGAGLRRHRFTVSSSQLCQHTAGANAMHHCDMMLSGQPCQHSAVHHLHHHNTIISSQLCQNACITCSPRQTDDFKTERSCQACRQLSLANSAQPVCWERETVSTKAQQRSGAGHTFHTESVQETAEFACQESVHNRSHQEGYCLDCEKVHGCQRSFPRNSGNASCSVIDEGFTEASARICPVQSVSEASDCKPPGPVQPSSSALSSCPDQELVTLDPSESVKLDTLKLDPWEAVELKVDPSNPVRIEPSEPVRIEPSVPVKIEPSEPIKIDLLEPVKIELSVPVKRDPSKPAKIDTSVPVKVDCSKPVKIGPSESPRQDSLDSVQLDPLEPVKTDLPSKQTDSPHLPEINLRLSPEVPNSKSSRDANTEAGLLNRCGQEERACINKVEEENRRGQEGLRVCLIGLHCCGDLTPAMLRLYRDTHFLRALCCVSCCYHKMQLSPGSERFINFPMSVVADSAYTEVGSRRQPSSSSTSASVLSSLKSASSAASARTKEIFLTPCSLRLAAQETRTRWAVQTSEDHDSHTRHVAYRAVLELFFRDALHEKPDRKSVRKLDYSSFDHFVQSYLTVVKVKEDDKMHATQTKLRMLYDSCKANFQHIQPYTCLQVIMQPVLEWAVLRDRQQWLTEQGLTSELLPVFDDHISPRNLALVSVKKNDPVI